LHVALPHALPEPEVPEDPPVPELLEVTVSVHCAPTHPLELLAVTVLNGDPELELLPAVPEVPVPEVEVPEEPVACPVVPWVDGPVLPAVFTVPLPGSTHTPTKHSSPMQQRASLVQLAPTAAQLEVVVLLDWPEHAAMVQATPRARRELWLKLRSTSRVERMAADYTGSPCARNPVPRSRDH
jgi:hypothetical protein